MLTKKHDPSDMRVSTIEKLFYLQFNELTRKTAGVEEKMNSFDSQFSDGWL